MSNLAEAYGEFPVYPGHPVTVALEIMLAFNNDLSKALERTERGYPEAVASSDVSGGGSSVREGCDLLRFVRDGVMTPREAVQWGFETWFKRTVIGKDHEKKYLEGELQALRLYDDLLKRLEKILEKAE